MKEAISAVSIGFSGQSGRKSINGFAVVFSQQLEEIQRQLNAEQKKNKELSSTLVRLNGIIKTGQDALSQEQKLVKQLQEQLTDKAKVKHNQPLPPTHLLLREKRHERIIM